MGNTAKLSHRYESPCQNFYFRKNAIGYDINCGVRLLLSQLAFNEVEPHLEKLANMFFKDIPSGVGVGGSLKLGKSELDQVLKTESMRFLLKIQPRALA